MATPGDDHAAHAQLMARARAGDAEAFGWLYRTTRDDVARYVRSRGVERSVADDLVMITYLRAFRAAPRFESRQRPVLAWLITIARNVVNTHHRRRSALPPLSGDARTGVGPDDLVIDRFERIRALRALDRLSARHRQVLWLRYGEAWPVARCAEAMGLEEAAVRALTYRALRSLRRSLAVGDPGGSAGSVGSGDHPDATPDRGRR